MAYDNTNTGILTKNEKRRDENDAEYTGSINAGGTEYWLKAWVNEGKEGGKLEGKKYFRITLKAKDEQAKPPRTAPTTKPRTPDDDEDLPF